MASFASPSPMLAQAQEFARRIALADGGAIRVREAVDQLHEELKARESVPEITTVWAGRQRIRYRSRIVTVAPQIRYSVRITEVRQRFPDPEAYGAAIRISVPKYPYQVRLEKAGRGKSSEWEEIRAQGAAIASEVLATRFGGLRWNIGTEMAVLKQLRLDLRVRELRQETIRQDFVAFAMEHGLPLTIPMLTDGRVRLQANTPHESLDLEILRTIPGAADLIRSHEAKGYSFVDFREIKSAPEDEEAVD